MMNGVILKAYCMAFEKFYENKITEVVNCNIIAQAVISYFDPDNDILGDEGNMMQIQKIVRVLKKTL